MHNRAFHKWAAKAGGFFWAPCPLCGQEFGGHEWILDPELRLKSSIKVEDSPNTGTAICPDCTLKGLGTF